MPDHIADTRLRRSPLCLGFILLSLFIHTPPAIAQVEEARQAMAEEDYLRVVEILSETTRTDPSADASLYLGLAYRNLVQYDRALELFEAAARMYPDDVRFLNETAELHVRNRDLDLAKDSLRQALAIAPADEIATDLLASIHLSEGDLAAALDTWNGVGQPRIDEVLQNFSPAYLNWSVPQALSFGPGEVLAHDDWRTTKSRLYASKLYANLGLDLEPSPSPDLYNAIVRTTPRGNTPSDILLDLLRGIPVESTFLDIWDIGHSGVSVRSHYRWDEDRRRIRGQLLIPLPLPGLPVLEFRNVWRSERWNMATRVRPEFEPEAEFHYKSNSIGFELRAVPDHRLEFSIGFEYRNRAASGTITELGMDARNSGTFRFGAIILARDKRLKTQFRLDGFVARSAALGDFDFSGGSLEIANRFVIDEDEAMFFDWSVTGGTARGDLPVDHYFSLGIGSTTQHLLRGHVASDQGRYGRSPMGTDFVLLNTDVERRIVRVPMFNALSIPFVDIKVLAFFDTAKVFDRQRIFTQGQWLNDVGAGFRFETPTTSFTVVYGHDMESGDDNFYGYVERRFW